MRDGWMKVGWMERLREERASARAPVSLSFFLIFFSLPCCFCGWGEWGNCVGGGRVAVRFGDKAKERRLKQRKRNMLHFHKSACSLRAQASSFSSLSLLLEVCVAQRAPVPLPRGEKGRVRRACAAARMNAEGRGAAAAACAPCFLARAPAPDRRVPARSQPTWATGPQAHQRCG